MESELEWVRELQKYLKRSTATDILADYPENAFNVEKGNWQVSKLESNGLIPFRRYFAETPSVSVWLTFKFTDNEADIATEVPPKVEVAPPSPGWLSGNPRVDYLSDINNNNNNNSNSPIKTNNNNSINKPKTPSMNSSSNSMSPKSFASAVEQETYCYKFIPSAYEVETHGITLRHSELFAIDSSAEIHYIAYNRSKPVDPSLRSLIAKLSLGGPDTLSLVREWVESGHYISETNTDEQSLLHISCQYSQDAVAKWLVDRGIELEKKDKNGWTPILCAINANNINLVDYLIRKGAMTQPVFTTNGSSYFHYLVRIIPAPDEMVTYVRILEEANKIYQSKSCQPNFISETPLHRAASTGNIAALAWLLDSNRVDIDPNQETKFGDTALHHAVKSGNPKVVTYLVNHFRIDVPARYPPNSPYNLAIKAKLPEIANLFPIEAKLRLYHLNSYLLQYITDLLDPVGLAKCSGISHRFRNLAKATLKRRYKGRAPEKIGLFEAIDRVNIALSEDLKTVSTSQFLEGWNRYHAPPAANNDALHVKLIMVGTRKVGASTILSSLGIAPGMDFVIKNMDFAGDLVRLQVWDKMYRYGRYDDIPSSYFRGPSVMIILYDSSDPSSVNDMKMWLGQADRFLCNCTLLFVGTKADLPGTGAGRVTTEQIAEYMKSICDVPLFYTDFNKVANADELARYPYVVETRLDDPESIERMLRLAAYMGIRFKKALLAAPPSPPRPRPPKKSIVSSFKNLFK